MFRVIKESENVDERHHCFLIQTATAAAAANSEAGAAKRTIGSSVATSKAEASRYFSMETRAELLKLESAWHRAVCTTISQIGVFGISLPTLAII